MIELPDVKPIFEVAEEFRPLGKPIMTGMRDFDSAMDGGVRGGELITISGMSGHGKTSYALWLTKRITDSGVPTLWFTYEMNPWYLKEKFVALGADSSLAAYVPIQHSGNSADFIKAHIEVAMEKHACKVVFIDHLHYLIPPENEQNISLVIGGVVRKLKQLAVETDSIIYLIAHMRKLQMGEKVDVNAVRDSALIINESDYVYLVERLKKKEKARAQELIPGDDMTDVSRVSLAKNRRTGKLFHRLYHVSPSGFDELPQEQFNLYE